MVRIQEATNEHKHHFFRKKQSEWSGDYCVGARRDADGFEMISMKLLDAKQ